jgi:DNA-binding NarL/FixJ family response regulator
MPRVLLVDDHTLVRAGLKTLIETIEGVTVVGEASNGREALRLATSLKPDIVFMDIAMPEFNGLEATERLFKDMPNCHVIILSMTANEEYVRQSLRAGANGYLLKDADTIELKLAIKAVLDGDSYFSPRVAKYARRLMLDHDAEAPSLLTPRQREILQLIAEGDSSKQIAQKLDLSTKTVETHRTQLMERLDIHDIAGLVRYAIRMGIVLPEK